MFMLPEKFVLNVVVLIIYPLTDKIISTPISNTSPSQLLMPNLAPPNLVALSAQFFAMPFMNPFLA